MTQGSIPLIVHHGYFFGILLFCHIANCILCFYVSLVLYVVVLRGCIQDQVFDCKFCLLV